MRLAAPIALLAAAALLAITLPAAGNHVQTDAGKPIVFDHKTGNEWWIEVVLSGEAAGSVALVEAMDTNGAWVKLEKKSWGAYAASFRIEPGHDVRFRATWSGGAQQTSCWFSHPAGAEKCSTTPPPPPPPPPTGYKPTLSGIKGNEWWIQVNVQSDRPLAGVDARVDGGTWVPLKLQSWGGWAVSTHTPQGAEVQFRVRAADGSLYFPPNGWTWTAAAPFPADRGVMDAVFVNVKGNAGWVQVNVYTPASRPAARVEAQVGTGAWQALARQSYGDWARAVAAPDGSLVRFRACDAAGACIESGQYRWPSAMPVTWPMGTQSYVTYHVAGSGGSPGGDFYDSWDLTLEFRAGRDGTWAVRCTGTERHYNAYATPQETTSTVSETFAYAPPMWRTDVQVGQAVTGPLIARCIASDHTAIVTGTDSVATKKLGQPVTAPSWRAYEDSCGCQATEVEWSRHHGLLLEWSFAGRGGGYHGVLVDTDAQIA